MSEIKLAVLSMSSITPDQETDMVKQQDGLKRMLASVKKAGFDHQVIYEKTTFGTQLPVVVDWCEKNRDNYTHIIYADMFDIMVVGDIEECLSKLPKGIKFFGSAEKACYPHPELAPRYPTTRHDWKFVNAGNWFAEINFFLDVMVKQQHPQGINDQVWLSERYLQCFEERMPVNLDFNCDIFQSIAFEHRSDFAVTRSGRLFNRKTHSIPLFLHGNGGGDMQWAFDINKQPEWESETMRADHPMSETMKKIQEQTRAQFLKSIK